jgi:hypothetical protein
LFFAPLLLRLSLIAASRILRDTLSSASFDSTRAPFHGLSFAFYAIIPDRCTPYSTVPCKPSASTASERPSWADYSQQHFEWASIIKTNQSG